MIKRFRKLLMFTLIFLLTPNFIFNQSLTQAQKNYLEEGIRNYRLENFEEAYQDLLKAREQNPESSLTAFYLGLTLKQIGELREAVEEFKRALNLEPPVLDAYFELIELLLTLNELMEAKLWLEKAKKDLKESAKLHFISGMVYMRLNKTKDAIAHFEKAKTLDKSLEQAIDFQIALAYARERKFKTALRTIKSVVAIDPRSDLAEFAKEYEKNIEALLREYKPLRGTISYTFQMDDNAVGADGEIVSRKSDNSHNFALSLNYQPYIEPPFYFTSSMTVSANQYIKLDKLNTKNIGLVITPGVELWRGLFTLSYNYQRSWLDEREYSENYGFRPSFNLIPFEGHIFSLSAGFSKSRMIRKPLDPEESRTAKNYSYGASYVKPFLEGRGMLSLRYEHIIAKTEGKNWQSEMDKLGGVLILPIGNRLKLSLYGEIGEQRYKFVHTFFEKKRLDKPSSLGTGLSLNIWKTWDFNINYNNIKNKSNIKVYNYKRELLSLGLDFNF